MESGRRASSSSVPSTNTLPDRKVGEDSLILRERGVHRASLGSQAGPRQFLKKAGDLSESSSRPKPQALSTRGFRKPFVDVTNGRLVARSRTPMVSANDAPVRAPAARTGTPRPEGVTTAAPRGAHPPPPPKPEAPQPCRNPLASRPALLTPRPAVERVRPPPIPSPDIEPLSTTPRSAPLFSPLPSPALFASKLEPSFTNDSNISHASVRSQDTNLERMRGTPHLQTTAESENEATTEQGDQSLSSSLLTSARKAAPARSLTPALAALDSEEVTLLKLRIAELIADRNAQLAFRPEMAHQAAQCELLVEAEDVLLPARLAAVQGHLSAAESKIEDMQKENAALVLQKEAALLAAKQREQDMSAAQQQLQKQLQDGEAAKSRMETDYARMTRQLAEQLQHARAELAHEVRERDRLTRVRELEAEMARQNLQEGEERALRLEQVLQQERANAEERLAAVQRRAEAESSSAAHDKGLMRFQLEENLQSELQRNRDLEARLKTIENAKKAELADLKKNADDLLRALDNEKQLRKAKEAARQQTEAELHALRKDFDAEVQRAIKAEEKVKAKQKEVDEAVRAFQPHADRASSLEEQIQNLQHQLQAARSDLEAASKTLAVQSQFGRELEVQLGQTESHAGKLTSDVQERDRQLATEVLHARDATSRLHAALLARDEEAARSAHLRGELEALKAQHQALIAEHRQLHRQMQDDQATVRSLMSRVAEQTEELNSYTSRIQQAESKLANAAALEEMAQAKQRQLEQELQSKHKEAQDWQKTCAEHDRDLQLARKSVNNLQYLLERAQADAKKRRPADKAPDPMLYVPRPDMEALMLENSAYEKELNKYRLETLQLQGHARSMDLELKELRRGQFATVLTTQLQQREQELAAAQEALREREEEAILLTQELEGRMEEQQNLRSDMAKGSEQLHQLKTKVVNLETMIGSLNQQAAAAAQVRQELQGECTRLSTALEAATAACAKYATELEELERRLRAERSQSNERQSELTRLTRQVAQQDMPPSHYQIVKAESRECSQDFCSMLLEKCGASPIMQNSSSESSRLTSTMDLCIPITPTGCRPSGLHLAISPTRVCWSPHQPTDEDVLLCNLPAVPFTSPTPGPPLRRRSATYEGYRVTSTSEMRFTLSSSPAGSAHFARLTKTKRVGVERWRRPGQPAHNIVTRTLCHPRLQSNVQKMENRWDSLSQWADLHRISRRRTVQERRRQPAPPLEIRPADDRAALAWREETPSDHASPESDSAFLHQVDEPSMADTEELIDAQLAANARDIPSDFDLVHGPFDTRPSD